MHAFMYSVQCFCSSPSNSKLQKISKIWYCSLSFLDSSVSKELSLSRVIECLIGHHFLQGKMCTTNEGHIG
ncbi:uncharacterized protein PHALS_14942 [Plasmopara halstedii]|uniref:Uncharacterized protein n=1 Tax=Plasmopara halstedii TaxID=4781 RepID=A0A0N7L7F2_PLAHL|nr:uncharacterized protein PHALS_14942 [Plasmopara halstedii]CEG46907.1 hypothetical protein PHALS_14942 [Plasmopara halstedii]|eukprot:XP_024583276.1 hypothetical protein PHALS_14942 [Plasmopara halstedii]